MSQFRNHRVWHSINSAAIFAYGDPLNDLVTISAVVGLDTPEQVELQSYSLGQDLDRFVGDHE